MNHPLHLFVLIDALGWTYVEDSAFLSDLLPYRKPLRTVLGYSSGAIPTLLTGRPPNQNGHWNLFYYAPEGSPFQWLRHFRFLPKVLIDNRFTRKLLKEMGRRFLGLGPGFECCVRPSLLPYFNWVEKKNIYERGGISGAPSIFDLLEEASVAYRSYSFHNCGDEEIIRRAKTDVAGGQVSFLFLYLCELDMFLHTHCVDQAAIRRRLDWYDARLRGLFKFAQQRYPAATFTVCSDHGMTPVRKTYDLMRDVEALEFEMPGDYLAVYDSTMARFWFFSDRARKQILEVLGKTPSGRVLSDDELRQLGVFFEDRRFGEVVFLLDPGWILAHSDFNGPQWMPAGMHGYHPDDPHSDAIFLSNRKPSEEPRTIADVGRLMRAAISR